MTAISALDSPFGVECSTPRTAVIHGAGKPLSDQGAEDENGSHQQKSKNRLSHEHPDSLQFGARLRSPQFRNWRMSSLSPNSNSGLGSRGVHGRNDSWIFTGGRHSHLQCFDHSGVCPCHVQPLPGVWNTQRQKASPLPELRSGSALLNQSLLNPSSPVEN